MPFLSAGWDRDALSSLSACADSGLKASLLRVSTGKLSCDALISAVELGWDNLRTCFFVNSDASAVAVRLRCLLSCATLLVNGAASALACGVGRCCGWHTNSCDQRDPYYLLRQEASCLLQSRLPCSWRTPSVGFARWPDGRLHAEGWRKLRQRIPGEMIITKQT